MTFAWLRRMGGSLLEWLGSTRGKALALTLIVAVGLFGLSSVAHAAGPSSEEIKKWIFGVIGEALAFIIELLGKLIIVLVNVLIAFASYNDFVHAGPVIIGWVLVRDVVNMFFIVILLISAFSTIIGYSEFHYTKVLPKLLLMAVLINFSRTFIGLMIDFSQVLMLTFVNAFQASAGGNFVSMLNLTKITHLDDELNNINIEALTELIVASLLGIIMLGIVVSVLVVMIAFLIYRIIALWMLLIISPMAFFALALPGKLAKGMSAFTSAFWERLSGLLVGGPVMAFFLWLALAIAQGGTTYNSLYDKNKQSAEIADASRFVSKAGSPDQIAAFIVAIAFLLTGLESAVKTAGALSPSLGKFASSVTSGGGAVPNAIVAGLRASSRTARVAGKSVRAVGAGVGAAGRGVAAVGRGADKLSGGYLSTQVGRAGLAISPTNAKYAQMAETKNRLSQAKVGALDKQFAGVNMATRDNALRGMGSPAAQILLAKSAGTSQGLKNRKALIEEGLKEQYPDMDKAEMAALVEARALDQASGDLAAGKAAATKIGDDTSLHSFKDALEKNPSLHTDWKEFAGIKGASVDDPKKYIEKISAESVKDSRTALAHMKALGLAADDGSFIRNSGNEETWKQLLSGDRGKLIQAHVDAYSGAGGSDKVRAQFEAMNGGDVAAANRARHYATVKDGFVGSVFAAPGGAAVATRPNAVQQNVAIRNEVQIQQGSERLRALAANNTPANAPEAQEAQRSMLAGGANLAEAFNLNQNAEFASQQNREAFKEVMESVSDGLVRGDAESSQIIRNLDTASLSKRPEEYNEARSAAVAALSTESLRRAYDRASQNNDEALRNKITDLMDVVDQEAKRVSQITAKAGSRAALVDVASGVNSQESRDAIRKMIDAGAQRPERAIEAARAAILSQQIDTADSFRAIRGEVGSRAERSAERARSERESALRRRRGTA